jgi:hypothetical protein
MTTFKQLDNYRSVKGKIAIRKMHRDLVQQVFDFHLYLQLGEDKQKKEDNEGDCEVCFEKIQSASIQILQHTGSNPCRH